MSALILAILYSLTFTLVIKKIKNGKRREKNN